MGRPQGYRFFLKTLSKKYPAAMARRMKRKLVVRWCVDGGKSWRSPVPLLLLPAAGGAMFANLLSTRKINANRGFSVNSFLGVGNEDDEETRGNKQASKQASKLLAHIDDGGIVS
jgi:hypothetical protein